MPSLICWYQPFQYHTPNWWRTAVLHLSLCMEGLSTSVQVWVLAPSTKMFLRTHMTGTVLSVASKFNMHITANTCNGNFSFLQFNLTWWCKTGTYCLTLLMFLRFVKFLLSCWYVTLSVLTNCNFYKSKGRLKLHFLFISFSSLVQEPGNEANPFCASEKNTN